MLSNQGVKKHFKMYKSGRLWMIAGIATTVMTLSYSPRVYGDTVNPTPNEVSTPKTGVDNNAKSAELKPVGSDGGVVNTASTQKDISTTSAQASSGSLNQKSNIAKDSGTSPLSESANAVSQTVTSVDSLESGSTEKAPSPEETASSAADVNGLSESKQITGSSEGRISAESVQASQVNFGAVSATSVQSAKPSEIRQNIETASVSGNSAISKSDTSTRDLSTVGKINRTQSAVRPMALNFLTTDDTEPIDQWMPNKTLQKIVLDELRTVGKKAGSQKTWSSVNDITQSDMLLLNSLTTQGYETYIDGKTSFSLEGLQYATNLTDLNFNRQMNSTPVDGNPLVQTHGDITDLSPLKNLVNLTTLEFNGNRVSDITPIAGLKKITRLIFPNNNVADLSSLNAAQYTDGLYYSGQIIEQPLVKIPDTMTYTMVNPVKPAQGITYQYAEYKGIYFALHTSIASPNVPADTYRAFLNAGPSSFDGKNIKYQNIHVQVVPDQTPRYPTDHYLTNDLKVDLAKDFGTPWYLIQDNPKTYYMISQFFAPDGLVAATILTPYDVAPNAKDVTVKYVDEAGSSIADDKTLSGLVGDPYTSEALSPVPADYELTATPTNYKGTFSDTAQTVTYVYKKVNSTITIHYKDDKGNTIKDDTTSTGKIGTAFNLTHPDIDGYEYVSTTGTPSGKYTKDSAEVTFVYKVAQSTITVHYQDDKGNTIKPDTTSTGDIGSTFNLTHPNIDGYEYVSTTGTPSGKYTKDSAEVTFVYKVAQSTITVHYQDEKGNTIKSDTTSTGDIGSPFNLTHPDIDGYTYQSTKGVTSGKYAGTNVEVTFVYHINEVVPPTTPETPITPEQPGTPGMPSEPTVPETPVKPEPPTIAPTNNGSDSPNLDARQGTVTVKYVTDSGQQVAPTVVMTGKQGTSYITAPVAGLSTVYQLEKIPENASGLYESNNQVVIYVYKIAAPVADNSTKPLAAIKTDSVETVHHERAGVVLPPRTSNYDLPKTNQKHAATSVIGFASLGFLFGGLAFSKRRKHD
ncbi:MucBP domain-containing protein [Furfurilactobacillus milii]|uniref:LPXTG cell wall anchor domain-containing protein n=1 Tax=Furfurilactobacillus milii TaxID=2888272 RepID=A0A6N9I5D9_9LACO|nr:MucBP domain-containing protein [Furfurilactobacillus milii]MYV17646.1 LPXTG cell wall anchor domain-containing protein [Furfurilactobacillus milii]